MKIPNVIKPVETEKEELRSCDQGRLRSCYLEAPALPALLALPRLFTLAGRCVSLLCWLRGWGGAGVPSGVWGSRTRRCAVLGGRWGVRSQENVNFIPSCRCGTSVQQGRGRAVPPGAGRRCCCRRGSAAFVPAALCGRRAPRLLLPGFSFQRSGRCQQFCFLKKKNNPKNQQSLALLRSLFLPGNIRWSPPSCRGSFKITPPTPPPPAPPVRLLLPLFLPPPPLSSRTD